MKKLSIVLSVLLALGLLVSMVGCAEPAEPVEEKAPPVEEKAPPVEEKAPPKEEKEAPPVEEVWEWPKTLSLTTIGTTSSFYAMTIAWTAVMEEKTGVKARVVPEEVVQTRARYLRNGIVDVSSEAAGWYGDFLEASGGFATRDGGPTFHEASFYIANISPLGFIVREDSDIKTIYDVKPGTRVAYLQFPAAFTLMDTLLAWNNLTRDDIVVVPFSSLAASIKSVMEGKADVTFASPISGATYEVASGPHGLRYLDMPYDEDPEALARAMKVRPDSEWGRANVGVKEAQGVRMYRTSYLYTVRADKDPEFVYQLVKWLDENYDAFKDKHAACPGITLETTAETAGVAMPVHEGCIRYLKEKGLWTDEHEAKQEYHLALEKAYMKAYQEAIDMADDKSIMVNPENEKWIELWENYKKELDLPPVRPLLKAPAKPWPWAK